MSAPLPPPSPRVSVIIPTLNGAGILPPLLAALRRAAAACDLEIVAIDSGSRDETPALLVSAGAKVLDLGGRRFGHASARNRAAGYAQGDVLLFLTQDVEPVGDGWLTPLLAALSQPGVAGAFGRQLPRGASPEEAFLASVNYGEQPRRITREALARPFGPGATLFSNAFGAVRREAWAQLPFPEIVMSEDQAWGLAALRAGWELRYVPAAAAYHGHAFSVGRAFRRNFDSGSSLQALGLAGGAWRSGLGHLVRELGWIGGRYGALRAARAGAYEAVRMAGFQLGRLERVLPREVARRCGEAPRA